jgi:large subunit ribosomal protein L22
LVVDLIRNKKASEALKVLRFCEKRESSLVLTKLINDALAIATERNRCDIESIRLDQAFVENGPVYKRIQPRAQGRAFKIRMRTSHIKLVLKEE